MSDQERIEKLETQVKELTTVCESMSQVIIEHLADIEQRNNEVISSLTERLLNAKAS